MGTRVNFPNILQHAACQGAKNAEGVMQSLVVNGGVQTLHKDVAGRIFPSLGVALTPHDPAWFALDAHVVQHFQGSLSLLFETGG
jgi:hypothetical protein